MSTNRTIVWSAVAACCILAWTWLETSISDANSPLPPNSESLSSENLPRQVQVGSEVPVDSRGRFQSSLGDTDRKSEVDNLVEESVSGLIASNPESKLYLKHLESCVPERGKQMRAFRVMSYFGSRYRDLTNEETEIEMMKQTQTDSAIIQIHTIRLADVRSTKHKLFDKFSITMRRISINLSAEDLSLLYTFRPPTYPEALLSVTDSEFFDE